MGSTDDIALLKTGSTINGTLDGQGGTNRLTLFGTGSGVLDVGSVVNFAVGQKADAGTWTLTGANAAFVPTMDVQQGTLIVNSATGGMAVTVQKWRQALRNRHNRFDASRKAPARLPECRSNCRRSLYCRRESCWCQCCWERRETGR